MYTTRYRNFAALILCISTLFAACSGGGGGGGPVSDAKAITSFSITSPAATGIIDETAKTITVSVPFGTNVTALIAAFMTTGSSVKVGSTVQVSGTTPNNFTSPVAYVVTAADGSGATYTVTVTPVVVSHLAGPLGGYGNLDGTGAAARFYSPGGAASDGTNLYIADTFNNTIRKIVIATGEVTTLAGAPGYYGAADGIGAAANFDTPYGITSDGTYLYVADTANHTIRKIVIASGEVTTFAGTAGISGSTDGTGTAALFFSPKGITSDGTNLYVADTDNHVIRKIDIATREVTTLAGTAGSPSFIDDMGTAARFDSPFGIANDGTNLYVADTGNNIIRKIDIASRVVTTFASATFSGPTGITTDGTNLFVADTDNHTIKTIVIATGSASTLAGTTGTSGSADSTGAAAQFNYPGGITSVGTFLYVADTENHLIRKIVIASAEVTTLAGAAGNRGFANGAGVAARFSSPNDIASDGTNLYVADTYNHVIRKIVIASGEVTVLAGQAETLGSDNGTGTAATFNGPTGITISGANLYVSDTDNHTIRKIVISSGEVTTLAGTAGNENWADGIGPAAAFSRPSGITSDGTNLYVADTGSNVIRKIVIATGEVTTFAGTAGPDGFSDGVGGAAAFFGPSGITSDGTNLYVADSLNNTIRKIVIATREVTTLAGTPPNGTDPNFGYADGTGAAASFDSPYGITNDGTNLYVADSFNDTIRKIVIATRVVTTLAGTAGHTGSVDGSGAAASFNTPSGIIYSGTDLYVADTDNNAIRKISM